MRTDSPFRSADERASDRRAKRDAVLLAAVRMFNERGYYATSLDEVAASLGISKRTIYHYLASKQQVLLECVTRGLQQLVDAAGTEQRTQGSGRDRLERYLRRHAEINMDDFGRCVIRSGEEALSPGSMPQYRTLKRQVDNGMRDLIAQAVADRSIAQVDVKIAAFMLAGALNWPARWYDPNGPLTPAKIASEMVALLMHGLAPGV